MGLYNSIAWDATKELYVTSIQTPAMPANSMPEAIITVLALLEVPEINCKINDSGCRSCCFANLPPQH